MATMFSSFSTTMLNYLLRGGSAPTIPANVYVALGSTNSSASAAGTEETATGYARQPIADSTAGFSAPSGQAVSNAAAITYTSNASGNWVAITTWWIADAVTGGNNWVYANITSVAVAAGNAVMFNATALSVSAT